VSPLQQPDGPDGHALVNAALDCIILMDAQGRVTEFNPAAERTFGYARDEVLGQEMAQLLIPAWLRDHHRAGLARYLTTGESSVIGTRLEIVALRADGSEFPIELTVTRLPSTSASIFAGFIRDLTERRLDERRLAAHYAVSRALAEVETPEAMAAEVVSALGEHLEWEHGAMWQRDRDGAVLRCTAVGHSPTAITPGGSAFETATQLATFAPGVGLPGRVWETGEPYWTDDIAADDNFPRGNVAEAAGLHTAFAFPIRHAGEVLGVVEFFSRSIRQPDEELFRVVEGIGNDIGQFLHRKALEEELRLAYARDSNIARLLQEALRPTLPGPIPGLDIAEYYRPALNEASVGGDFFDVFALRPDCYALVVADLSGKGLHAAAQTATVRHMLRTLLYLRRTTIAEAATILNSLLLEHHLLAGGFATLFVGAYDTVSQTLTYVSCGQEPGLIRRAATGAIEEIGPTGAVLGGFRDATFEERTISLDSGDVFAIFTDGLTESGLDRTDLLGLTGVRSLFAASTGDSLPAAVITRRLIDRIEETITPAGIRDDVCLLIARVE